MTQYIYTIDDKNAIRIWDTENPNTEPFFYQPDWPDATPWASRDEAQAWAEVFIKMLEDPTYPFEPGDSPQQPQKPRPVVE